MFLRTYSRQDNPKVHGHERWHDVCERVINGMYQIQEIHQQNEGGSWDNIKAQRSAREAFDLMFRMKWTPPGRGLQMMGTPFVMEKGVAEALQNCAFISSQYIKQDKGSFFSWIMHMSMLGVGVGFDTKGAKQLQLQIPRGLEVYRIPDTREGWAESLERLVNSYVQGTQPYVEFDYKSIRPKGTIIRGFGGLASGPVPLVELHDAVRVVLDSSMAHGGTLNSRDIVDIANMVGRCVVSGNVRRSAEIAFGEPTDLDFINLKNYEINPYREDFGWVSNNSVMVVPGQDYSKLAKLTYENGEPGYAWMDNVHNYARMNSRIDSDDFGAVGFNPCGEQPLEHKEMCTLVEIYLPRIKDKTEFRRALKFAYLYGKSVTLATGNISDPVTRAVMTTNRRIGLSLTGITQFDNQHGREKLEDWMDHGYHWSEDYDRVYSKWLNIPMSVRRTSVKPSGSVSLVVGVTPGIHYNVEDRYHVRRIIIPTDSPLVSELGVAGYLVEPSVVDPDNSVVVSFPIDAGEGTVSEKDVSPRDHLALIASVARYWADNAVSATVKFDKEKYNSKDIEEWLSYAETRLKDISFLPLAGGAGYKQAPYESITKDEYNTMIGRITELDYSLIINAHDQDDKYCDGESCAVK